jgi:hypothetical protein
MQPWQALQRRASWLSASSVRDVIMIRSVCQFRPLSVPAMPEPIEQSGEGPALAHQFTEQRLILSNDARPWR